MEHVAGTEYLPNSVLLHGFEHNSSADVGTSRCYMTLVHVPDTFSWVCTCCNNVAATCPRYTFPRMYNVILSLLHVSGTCPCFMAQRNA